MEIKNIILRLLPEKLLFQIKKIHYLRSLKSFWENDMKVVQFFVKPGEYVIDIGANVGWYTKFLSDLVGVKGKVYSIEPIPPTFQLLSYCVNELELKNVELINIAVSEKNGSVVMEVPMFNSGGENFYQARIIEGQKKEKFLKEFKVESRSIDSLLSDPPGRISFIKCDVEGHELAVIKGASLLIGKYKPALLVEVSQDPDDQSSDAYMLFKYLESFGYLVYWFDGKKLKSYCNGQKSVNYFFLTPEHLSQLKSLV